jgi:hypothetical protein
MSAIKQQRSYFGFVEGQEFITAEKEQLRKRYQNQCAFPKVNIAPR